MPGSSLPSPVSATQDKSPPFSTTAVKSPKRWRGEGDMGGGLLAGDDFKNEATLGVSNGAAMSTAKQKETSASFKDAAEAISQQAKAKKVSKNEPKMKLSKDERKALRRPKAQEEGAGADGDPVNHLDAAAFFDRNYGNVPLQFFQTFSTTPRSWTEPSELVPDTAGSAVLMRGWLQSIRPVGKKLTFLILRDGLSTVQCVLVRGEGDGITDDMVRFARALPKESFIEVHGPCLPAQQTCELYHAAGQIYLFLRDLFSNRIASLQNGQVEVEVSVEKLYCISRSALYPPLNFEDAARVNECGENLPQVALDTRLNNRAIDLRTPANQAIFRIQSAVNYKFTEFLLSKGFLSIHTPKITPGISEGGSSVFRLNYVNGQVASLAQSPQLYKQMAINSGLKKVFEVCTIFRAEKSNTHRHLCEYVGLHIEMEIKDHYFEVCNVLDTLFVELFDHLAEKYAPELEIIRKQFPFEPLKYHKETLKLRYAEGINMLKDSGFEIGQYDDLSTRAEKRLGQLVRDKYKTDFFILYEFPLAVCPFYTMPCFENPEYSNSFDVFIRGEEVVSGSQRIHSHELLVQRIEKCGLGLDILKDFTDSFLHGAPPRGGFGAGLERVVMLYCGLPNIRQAALFPRDPQRLAP